MMISMFNEFIPKGFQPLAGGKRSATSGLRPPIHDAPRLGASVLERRECCDPVGIGFVHVPSFRWCRFAQPPANGCDPVGVDRALDGFFWEIELP